MNVWVASFAVLLAGGIGCTRSDTASQSESNVRSLQQAATLTQFELELPAGAPPSSFALAASNSLRINDRAEVLGQTLNTGALETIIGADAKAATVTSIAPVTLRDRARVSGDVFTNGGVTRASTAVVEGSVLTGEAIAVRTRVFAVDFGTGSGGAIQLAPDQRETLAPGSYGSLTMPAGARLDLQQGRYYFATWAMDSGSELLVPSAGRVEIFVRNSVVLRGTFPTDPSAAQLVIALAGTETFQVDTRFSGVIIAPNAKLNLQTSGPFHGQAYAKDIELHQGLLWKGQAADIWDQLLDPMPNAPGEAGGTETIDNVIPSSAVGAAIRNYLNSGFVGTSAEARQAALTLLRAQPAAEVVAVLEQTFDSTLDASLRWALVDAAAALQSREAVGFFSELLARPVPDLSTLHAHQYDVERQGKILMPAVRGLVRLAQTGVSEARQPLLRAATRHALRAVRRMAVYQIVKSGNSSLRDELEASLSPQDRAWLTLRRMAPTDAATDPLGPSSTVPDSAGVAPGPGSGGFGGDGPQPSGGTGGTGGTGTGGTGTGGTGTGGGGSGGVCDETTAIDLGSDGQNRTVSNGACLRVRDAYPSWWLNRTMKLETTAGGTYPVPFVWENSCSGSSGSGTFSADWQPQLLGITSKDCATVISLRGAGNGNITIRYWAQ